MDDVKKTFENNKFGIGNQAAKARGKIKQRITTKLLHRFEEESEKGRKTPYILWMDIINGDVDFEGIRPRDVLTLQLKAAEHLSRYIYDASYETEEAESQKLSSEQIAALRAVFPRVGA